MRYSIVLPLILLALLAGGSCARRSAGVVSPVQKLNATAYFQDGTEVFLGVDVRSAQMVGPQKFLPLLVAVHVKSTELVEVGREQFELELPEGTLLPLASYREFTDEYTRARQDNRVGEQFVESLAGYMPAPPYTYRSFDFYPLKTSSTIPRTSISLRQGEVGIGHLYFRLPEVPQDSVDHYKLLFRGPHSGRTYVVDFPPYKGNKTARKSG